MRIRLPALALLGICTAACLPSLNLPVPSASLRQPFHILATSRIYTAFPARTGQPSDFQDVTRDISPVPSWLVSGQWSLLAHVDGFSGGVYHQEETAPYPHVSMRRYAGTAFGANGNLPAHYRIDGSLQPFAMTDHMPPIGENGFLVYYVNPTTYVELVISGDNVAVWSADHAGPTGSDGWTGHHWFGQHTAAGDIRRLTAEIDAHAHTLTYWVEGQRAATLTIPLLTDTPDHTFALRSIGNPINVGDIIVQDLTDGAPSPAPMPAAASPGPSPTPSLSPPPGPTRQPLASVPPIPSVSPTRPNGFQPGQGSPFQDVWKTFFARQGS